MVVVRDRSSFPRSYETFMFKFNAGRIEHRNATLIGFGFTNSNLERLKEPDPIIIRASDIGIDAHFCVFYAGAGADTFQHWFEEAFETLKKLHVKEPEGKLPVLHMQDHHFFVVPLSVGDTALFAIGLTERAIMNMKDGDNLTYRLRYAQGEGDNHEIIMFSRPVLENMEAEFMGMIGPNTKVRSY